MWGGWKGGRRGDGGVKKSDMKREQREKREKDQENRGRRWTNREREENNGKLRSRTREGNKK